MKKLLLLSLTIVLTLIITGCGNKEDIIETAKCVLPKSNYVQQTYTYSATNDEIDKVGLKMVYDNEMFQIESFADLTDDQKEQIKSNMLTTLGLESTTYEGFELVIDIQDQMTVSIEASLKVADPEVLKKVGLDFSNTNMSFKTAVESMEDSGATCEQK